MWTKYAIIVFIANIIAYSFIYFFTSNDVKKLNEENLNAATQQAKACEEAMKP